MEAINSYCQLCNHPMPEGERIRIRLKSERPNSVRFVCDDCATRCKANGQVREEVKAGDRVRADFGPVEDSNAELLGIKARSSDGKFHLIQDGVVLGPSKIPQRMSFGDFNPPEAYVGRLTVEFNRHGSHDRVACRPEILTKLDDDDDLNGGVNDHRLGDDDEEGDQ